MKKRVLLVDDDVAVLGLLTGALRARNLDVTPCSEAAGALGRIQAARFDVGIFDIRLTGASGVDLLRRFREREPDAPAFVVSGAFTDATRRDAEALGARSVDKPFDLGRLCDDVAAAAARSTAAHPWSLLIVDDEPAIRRLLSEFFSAQGYAVAAAADGAEALRQIQGAPRPYDLAFVDINMPRLDGVGFIRELDRLWPETLPIIITGEGTSQQVENAYAAGAETLLRKPFQLEDLARFIEALDVTLQERRARAADRRKLAAQGPVDRLGRTAARVLTAPAGTTPGEIRNTLIVCGAMSVLLLLGLYAWRTLAEAAERQAQETRALVEQINSRLAPPPPAAPSRRTAGGAGAGESERQLGEFIKRLEGYLQRDEQREVEGTEGPVRGQRQ